MVYGHGFDCKAPISTRQIKKVTPLWQRKNKKYVAHGARARACLSVGRGVWRNAGQMVRIKPTSRILWLLPARSSLIKSCSSTAAQHSHSHSTVIVQSSYNSHSTVTADSRSHKHSTGTEQSPAAPPPLPPQLARRRPRRSAAGPGLNPRESSPSQER